MRQIEVVPYNPAWPKMFEQEAALIKQALGSNCIESHHIGSTSVPGLAAKPKVDIIAVVKEPLKTIKSLKEIGIEYKGEYNIPMHFGFSKRGEVNVNLHIYEEGHPEIELNLLFRDFLRNDSRARDEYAYLKETLLKDRSSFEKNDSLFTKYTLRKGDFIRKVLKEAGFNRLRMLKCNDEMEWNAAKYFRNKYFFSPYGIDDPYEWTFKHPEHIHMVLYQGTEIVGYTHIQLWPESRAAMRIIVIDEEKRNSNAGSTFLALCEKWLKSIGIKSLHAESRPTSISFYTKNGYREMPFDNPYESESSAEDIAVGKVL